MKDMVIVINGMQILASLNRGYEFNHDQWASQCAAVRAGFKKKTSRSTKNGKVYKTTLWYKLKSGGGLESVGKNEPKYEEYYPPEPKPGYDFEVLDFEKHLIISQKDYEVNQKLFKDCLVFSLEDCKNMMHPLYKNPEKALKDSVRKPGVSCVRSQSASRTEYAEEELPEMPEECNECDLRDEYPECDPGCPVQEVD